MTGARIDIIGQPQLFNSSEPLKIRVFNKVKCGAERDFNESINRIVYDFTFIGGQGHLCFQSGIKKGQR
jgi:hypothetical protein